jgi:hypothetical protein
LQILCVVVGPNVGGVLFSVVTRDLTCVLNRLPELLQLLLFAACCLLLLLLLLLLH